MQRRKESMQINKEATTQKYAQKVAMDYANA